MGDDPALYQIRVSGHLGPTLLTAFPAFAPQQQGAETVLTGLLPDAAALYGVLAEIEALGLDLLEVRRVRPPHRPDGKSPGSSDDLSPYLVVVGTACSPDAGDVSSPSVP